MEVSNISSSVNWEYQAPEVIAKELLIAIIQRNGINDPKSTNQAKIVGEMYNILLETITKKG